MSLAITHASTYICFLIYRIASGELVAADDPITDEKARKPITVQDNEFGDIVEFRAAKIIPQIFVSLLYIASYKVFRTRS